jgi:hypothetical protein
MRVLGEANLTFDDGIADRPAGLTLIRTTQALPDRHRHCGPTRRDLRVPDERRSTVLPTSPPIQAGPRARLVSTITP